MDVLTFYDEHPINERRIIAALEREGKRPPDDLTPEDLYPHDQDHYGGLAAVESLAEALDLRPDQEVLDVCSGVGGPARYLAVTYGVRVTGVDLNQRRVAAATRLTRWVGLHDRVRFTCGDAQDLAHPDDRFDAAISQEGFLHLPDKGAALQSIHRVLKPGGRLALTDWTALPDLTIEDRRRFAVEFAAPAIFTVEDYQAALAWAGFVDVDFEDRSEAWREILGKRLEMFRSMEDDTVRLFGRARHDAYIAGYEFFVARIAAGALGGGRFTATKPS